MKIDGIDVRQVYGVYMSFDTEIPTVPDIRLNIQPLSSHGSINSGSSHGERRFQLPCLVKGENCLEQLQEFTKLFFDENGEHKEVKVELSFFPNKYITCILAQPITINRFSKQYGFFNLELLAPDPFFRSIYEFSRYFEQVVDSVEIPITYYGTKSTGFTVSMFGSVGNIIIEVHKSSGVSSFQYNSAVHNTYLVIDFEKFDINDNGSNGLRNSSGEFLEIDRTTTKVVISGQINASLNLAYREKHIV